MKAKFVSENIKFERGGDPKQSMGMGLFSIVDEAARSVGLDQMAKIAAIPSGVMYQWQDKYGANAIDLTIYDGDADPTFDGINSEESYIERNGADEILEFIESGKFAKWINLEDYYWT